MGEGQLGVAGRFGGAGRSGTLAETRFFLVVRL
jgi:hypothetical protein